MGHGTCGSGAAWWVATPVGLALAIATAGVRAGDPIPITTEVVAEGLDRPLAVAAPPGDSGRLLIAEQGGLIKVLDLVEGTVAPVPFLDLSDVVYDGLVGTGLMDVAFDPAYEKNGYVYVVYFQTAGGLRSKVVRYTSEGDVADPDSAAIVIEIPQPGGHHDVNFVSFGPADGSMYVGVGDGSASPVLAGDAQDVTSIYGTIIRIDPHGTNGPGGTYGIPPDNPFVGVEGLDEIWAYGLRNPWRGRFDALTGDFWIGDVGQNGWEEVDLIAAGSPPAPNFGWKCMEGPEPEVFDESCEGVAFEDPIVSFTHGGNRCVVVGGEVYRGCAIPELSGAYFYADFCTAEVFSLRYDTARGQITEHLDRTSELQPIDGPPIEWITSFGVDALGEIYLCARGTGLNQPTTQGRIYKIVPAAPAPAEGTPSAPTDVSAVARSHSEVTVSWLPPAETPSGLIRYRIYRDGGPIDEVAGSAGSYLDAGLEELVTYGYQVSALDCAEQEGPASAPVEVTTPADLVPPVIQSSAAYLSPPQVRLVFSEALDADSATDPSNYQLDPALTVTDATLLEGVEVILATPGLAGDVLYTLSVSGVKDSSAAGNPVPAGTQVQFQIAFADLDGDGIVDASDLIALILSWGSCAAPPAPCAADLDGDGEVNVSDLILMILNWD